MILLENVQRITWENGQLGQGIKKMFVRLILVVLIVIAVGLPFALPYLSFGAVPVPQPVSEKPPFDQVAERAAIEVRTQQFEPRQFQSIIEVTAATSADKVRSIRSELGGEVESLSVRRGERVEPGSVIATVAAETRDSQTAQALASLEQARVDLEATRQLVDEGVYPQNRLSAAEAQFQAALAAVDQANQQVDNLSITSSIGGVVTEVSTEEGSAIAVGEPIATVLALDPIKVVAKIAEADIRNVSLGQTARATLVTGEEIDVIVTYIAPSANVATRTFEIEAEAPNPDFSIRDGVTATLEIERPRRIAYQINQSTLVTDENDRLGVRFVDDQNTARFAPVELLETSLESAWVTGLSADMKVMVVGQRFAEIGDPVVAKDVSVVADAQSAVSEQLDEN